MAYSLMKELAKQNNNANGEFLEVADEYQDMVARMEILTTLHNVNITGVRVVQNNYLRGSYELKKMEYKSRYGSVTEKTFVHSTSAENVSSIIKNNLDWRRVRRNRYGKGVSFSNDADYANYHSNSANGSSRAFIVASVLISHKVIGKWNMKIPPCSIDTSYSHNGKVYVKYCDNEFLPKYVVYYTAPDPTKSRHHKRRS